MWHCLIVDTVRLHPFCCYHCRSVGLTGPAVEVLKTLATYLTDAK